MFRHQRQRHRGDERFADRREAGVLLGKALQPLWKEPVTEAIVLGLARGGMVVAVEVAAVLGAPLDAVVVRKIGSPYQPELAIGAVGPNGVRTYNRSLIEDLDLSDATLETLTRDAERRRVQLDHDLRDDRALPDLTEKVAILVDDGLATGASMRAAVTYASRDAASVVVAVPVAAPDELARFEGSGTRTFALKRPGRFGAVGSWYVRFGDIGSEEVRALLAAATERAR